MKRITIADATLCRADNAFSFKEKIDIETDSDADGIPDYYNDKLFNQSVYPDMYFKLTNGI